MFNQLLLYTIIIFCRVWLWYSHCSVKRFLDELKKHFQKFRFLLFCVFCFRLSVCFCFVCMFVFVFWGGLMSEKAIRHLANIIKFVKLVLRLSRESLKQVSYTVFIKLVTAVRSAHDLCSNPCSCCLVCLFSYLPLKHITWISLVLIRFDFFSNLFI